MLTVTRVCLSLLGVSIIAIGGMMAVIGPSTTANFLGDILSAVFGSKAYSGGFEHTNADSEMRVLAVFFAAYGAVLLWLSTRLESHKEWVYGAIALYFAGGVTRLLSYASVGWPDALFLLLMAFELGAPIIIAVIFTFGLRAQR